MTVKILEEIVELSCRLCGAIVYKVLCCLHVVGVELTAI